MFNVEDVVVNIIQGLSKTWIAIYACVTWLVAIETFQEEIQIQIWPPQPHNFQVRPLIKHAVQNQQKTLGKIQ